MDTKADLLREYVLGANWAGPGLIRRVATKVSEMSQGYLPEFRTGSWLNASGSSKAKGLTSERVEQLFELAVDLMGWLTQHEPSPAATRALLAWLRKHEISDVDYLLGWEEPDRAGEPPTEGKEGKLEQVRAEVKNLLRTPTQSDVDRCHDLANLLKDFMGSCDHEWEEQPSEVKGVAVMRCPCGASFKQYRGDENKYAV